MGEDAKRYYPAFLDLSGRLVVVVGSGPATERKARQLTRYGADVTVITPDASDEMLEAESHGELTVEPRDYVRGDLAGAGLVLCMATDPEVQRAVFDEAHAVGCPVTIADNPALSSFIVPSMVHREPLQIAISTGGMAPQLSKHLRRKLAEEFGKEWGEYVRLVAEVRAIGMARLAGPAELDGLLESVFASDALERVRSGETPTAQELFDAFAPTPTDPEAAE